MDGYRYTEKALRLAENDGGQDEKGERRAVLFVCEIRVRASFRLTIAPVVALCVACDTVLLRHRLP